MQGVQGENGVGWADSVFQGREHEGGGIEPVVARESKGSAERHKSSWAWAGSVVWLQGIRSGRYWASEGAMVPVMQRPSTCKHLLPLPTVQQPTSKQRSGHNRLAWAAMVNLLTLPVKPSRSTASQ